MIRKLTMILLVISTILFSCKTKKAAIVKPSTQTSTQSDSELNSIKDKVGETQVRQTEQGIMFTFSSEILFPVNSSYLNAESSKSIDDVVKVIAQKKADRQILVEGHSDKTGTAEYNLWLSEKRAVSVKKYMVSLGIDSNRIKASGLGDTKPIADNKTKEGRSENRRVEVTLLN